MENISKIIGFRFQFSKDEEKSLFAGEYLEEIYVNLLEDEQNSKSSFDMPLETILYKGRFCDKRTGKVTFAVE